MWSLGGGIKACGDPKLSCRGAVLFSMRQSPCEGLNLTAPDPGAPKKSRVKGKRKVVVGKIEIEGETNITGSEMSS